MSMWKNSMVKKISALVLALLFLSMTACGPKESQTAKSDSVSSNTKATINILRYFGAPEYPENGGIAKDEILKKLEKDGLGNIDYHVSLVSSNNMSDYTTKLNILASSNQLPDYFNVDMPTMMKFADEGLIMPLDDLINKYDKIKKALRPADLQAITYNGHIYALPAVYRPEKFNGPNVSALIVRQDWLDSLGIQQPQTLDQVHEVLKAFTKNDPDKNGKNDTYGLTGDKNTTFDFVFGAFGTVCGINNDFWFVKDGKLKNGKVLPQAKEALAVLAQWYKEGLIDPDFPVMENKQMQEKVINSKAGMFQDSAFDLSKTQPITSSLLKVTPSAKFGIIMPPKGPDGLHGLPENTPGYGDLRAISAKAKNADNIMKLLQWSIDDTDKGGFYLVTYGIEGKDYNYDRQNNKIKQLVGSYSDLYKEGFSNPVRFLQVVDRRWMDDNALKGMEDANSDIIRNEFWGKVPVMNDYPDLNKLWNEYFVKIVTGKLPVSAWDEYVIKYYQQGGQKVEDQVNTEWQKIKK